MFKGQKHLVGLINLILITRFSCLLDSAGTLQGAPDPVLAGTMENLTKRGSFCADEYDLEPELPDSASAEVWTELAREGRERTRILTEAFRIRAAQLDEQRAEHALVAYRSYNKAQLHTLSTCICWANSGIMLNSFLGGTPAS
jgi:hypothetical protein